jgi:hypothetical protein
MLIRNYGLFWKADEVFWGRPYAGGSLLGVPAANIKAKPVDFRDQIAIYVLYKDFTPVYVGQTKDQRLFGRLRQHRRSSKMRDRWTRFSWFGIRSVKSDNQLGNENIGAYTTTKWLLDHIEAVLIEAMGATMNRQGGRFGPDVAKYVQCRDPQLEPTTDQMIRQIWKKIRQEG